jgi:hypothetical protein
VLVTTLATSIDQIRRHVGGQSDQSRKT